MNYSSRPDKALFRFVTVLMLGAFLIIIAFERLVRQDLTENWQCRSSIVFSQGNINQGNDR